MNGKASFHGKEWALRLRLAVFCRSVTWVVRWAICASCLPSVKIIDSGPWGMKWVWCPLAWGRRASIHVVTFGR